MQDLHVACTVALICKSIYWYETGLTVVVFCQEVLLLEGRSITFLSIWLNMKYTLVRNKLWDFTSNNLRIQQVINVVFWILYLNPGWHANVYNICDLTSTHLQIDQKHLQNYHWWNDLLAKQLVSSSLDRALHQYPRGHGFKSCTWIQIPEFFFRP